MFGLLQKPWTLSLTSSLKTTMMPSYTSLELSTDFAIWFPLWKRRLFFPFRKRLFSVAYQSLKCCLDIEDLFTIFLYMIYLTKSLFTADLADGGHRAFPVTPILLCFSSNSKGKPSENAPLSSWLFVRTYRGSSPTSLHSAPPEHYLTFASVKCQ